MMRNTLHTWYLMIISYFLTGGESFHVSLKVPRYSDLGGQVTLKCDYSVLPEQLYKVEWLKGGRKIFQYVRGRTPPFRNYTTPGAVLDWANSNEKQVTLKDLDFDASGLYSCEVSTETPIYTKPSDDHEMTVMQGQLEDPHISFGERMYTVGEWLQVNCTSGPARPTPDVTWLINGVQAEESSMKMFPEESPNSVTVQLAFVVEEVFIEKLELTCISTIPAFLGHHARHSQYADHRAHSIKVVVLPQTPEPIVLDNNCIGSSGSGQPSFQLNYLLFAAVLLRSSAQCKILTRSYRMIAGVGMTVFHYERMPAQAVIPSSL